MNGRFIKCDSGYNAFIPNPLPPQISWNESIIITPTNNSKRNRSFYAKQILDILDNFN